MSKGRGQIIHVPGFGGGSVVTIPEERGKGEKGKRGLLPAPLAVPAAVAAWMLGVSRTTLWARVNLPRHEPRRIKRTSYGTFPVAELERHLAAELEKA